MAMDELWVAAEAIQAAAPDGVRVTHLRVEDETGSITIEPTDALYEREGWVRQPHPVVGEALAELLDVVDGYAAGTASGEAVVASVERYRKMREEYLDG